MDCILDDGHKNKLLELAKQHPANVMAITDYLDELGYPLEKLRKIDTGVIKFCIVQSYVNHNITCKPKEMDKSIEDLKGIWFDLQ